MFNAYLYTLGNEIERRIEKTAKKFNYGHKRLKMKIFFFLHLFFAFMMEKYVTLNVFESELIFRYV